MEWRERERGAQQKLKKSQQDIPPQSANEIKQIKKKLMEMLRLFFFAFNKNKIFPWIGKNSFFSCFLNWRLNYMGKMESSPKMPWKFACEWRWEHQTKLTFKCIRLEWLYLLTLTLCFHTNNKCPSFSFFQYNDLKWAGRSSAAAHFINTSKMMSLGVIITGELKSGPLRVRETLVAVNYRDDALKKTGGLIIRLRLYGKQEHSV